MQFDIDRLNCYVSYFSNIADCWILDSAFSNFEDGEDYIEKQRNCYLYIKFRMENKYGGLIQEFDSKLPQ